MLRLSSCAGSIEEVLLVDAALLHVFVTYATLPADHAMVSGWHCLSEFLRQMRACLGTCIGPLQEPDVHFMRQP